MPTAEQQRLYGQWSGQLQAFGIKHRIELPSGAASLALILKEGQISIEAYDQLGKPIGIVPNEKSSDKFKFELDSVFRQAPSFEDPIIAPI